MTITDIRRAEPRGPYVYSYIGKSTDEKPINDKLATGSTFYELDTQNAFMFDEETQAWAIQ